MIIELIYYAVSLASIWLAIVSSMKYKGWKLILVNIILVYVFYSLGGLYGGWGSLILFAVIILEIFIYIKNKNNTASQTNLPPVVQNRISQKAVWSVIIGFYFTALFAVVGISSIFPKITDLVYSNTVLQLLILPMFIAVVFNFFPLILFLGIIFMRMKGIKEKTENSNWALWATILNGIAFVLLVAIILSTGKCIPGYVCF